MERDSNIQGAILADNHGLSLKAINMQKKSAANVKALADNCKGLKIKNTSEEAPMIVVETDKKNIIIHEKNDYVLAIARKSDKDDGTN